MRFAFTQKIISMLALLSIYAYANPMPTAEENDLVKSWHEVRGDGIVKPIKWCAGYTQYGCENFCDAQGFNHGQCHPGYVDPE